VSKIVTLVLGVDPAAAPALAVGSSPEWDSLRHIEIILAVEDEFGVMVPEALFPSMSSVDAITAQVVSLRASQ
jgi:acyl carrier protein